MISNERIHCRSLQRPLTLQAGTVSEQEQDCHRFYETMESYQSLSLMRLFSAPVENLGCIFFVKNR
jgi:hypothetical protein